MVGRVSDQGCPKGDMMRNLRPERRSRRGTLVSRRSRSRKNISIAIIAMVGFACMMVAAFLNAQKYDPGDYSVTTGEVVKVQYSSLYQMRMKGRGCIPVVEFEVDGEKHKTRRLVDCTMRVGDKIRVQYDPANPDKTSLAIRQYRWNWEVCIALFFAAAALVVSYRALRKVDNEPPIEDGWSNYRYDDEI